jgi:hypothetical protein
MLTNATNAPILLDPRDSAICIYKNNGITIEVLRESDHMTYQMIKPFQEM